MDNLITQGGGSSRLNFAQKVVASGMSLVLAFGLSPLGQAPAYADDNGGKIVAAQVVQTQDDEESPYTIVEMGGKYKLKVLKSFVYENKDWAKGDAKTDDLFKYGIVSVYTEGKDDKGNVTREVVAGADKPNYYVTGGEFYLSYKNSQNQDIDETHPVRDVDTYTVTIEGRGTFAGEKASATFSITPYNLNDVTKFKDGDGGSVLRNPDSMTYLGKKQTIHYSAGKYPSIETGKDVNGFYTEYNPDTGKATAGTVGTLGTLSADDIEFEPAAVTDFGNYDVVMKGKGNYTGSKTVRVSVQKGEFATPGNVTVNGAVNNVAGQEDFIDLTSSANAGKNPTVADPNPVIAPDGSSKVVFGTTPIPVSELDITYFKGDPRVINEATKKTDADELDEAPTKIGKGYYAQIKATGAAFKPQENNLITVKYDITVGSALNEVVDKADFGSASYIAPTPTEAQDSSYRSSAVPATTSEGRKFATEQALVVPTNVKFTSAAGSDVTSAIGNNYRIWKVQAWDEDLEREFLGDEAYNAKYPFSDEPYQNSEAVVDYFSNLSGKQKLADFFAENTYTDDSRNRKVYGFNGLPAGDYQLWIVGDKDYGSDTKEAVYGKFTVSKATPVFGTGVGQLQMSAGGKAMIKDVLTGDDPVIKMFTGAKLSNDAETYTQQLVKGSTWAVASGKADYSITYLKDGKEVDPEEDGTYDAKLTFGGENFENATMDVKDALVVGKPELKYVVNHVGIEEPDSYMYTGSKLEPKLVFYTVSDEEYQALKIKAEADGASQADKDAFKKATINLKKDVDYTVSYVGVSGNSSGTPIGIGKYDVYVSGAGKYTSTYNKKDDTRLKVKEGYEIRQLDLKTALENKFATVQFDDNGKWVEDYSVVASDTLAKPAYRIVVTDTKGDDNPVVIASNLYNGSYDYSALQGAPKMGTVTLNIKPNGDAVTDGDVVNEDDSIEAAKFHIASSSFTDEAVDAKIQFAVDSGTRVVEKNTYAKDGQDLTISIADKDGNPITVQYAEGSEGADFGQAIWELTKGKKSLLKSTDKGVTASTVADQLKKKVVDAGEYTLTIRGGDANKYAGEVSAKFTVEPKEITSSDKGLTITWNNTENRSTFAFDGSKHTAIANGKGIRYIDEGDVFFTEADSVEKGSGNQYVISGHKATDAGDYTAKIEFTGNYTGTVEKTWKVKSENIADLDLVYLVNNLKVYDNMGGFYNPDDAYYKKGYYAETYDGTEHEPTVSVYRPTYKTVADTSAGEKKTTKRLADGSLIDCVVDANGDYIYTDLSPVKGLEYTHLWKNTKDATPNGNGRYWSDAGVTVVASGGNYTGRVTKYFPIMSLSMSKDRVKVSFDNDDLFYTGKAVEPKGTLTYTNNDGSTFTLVADKDYKVTYTGDNVNVGGNAVAKFTGLEPNFVGGNDTFLTAEFSVKENNRQPQTISYLGEKAISMKVGDAAFKLAASTNASDGKVEFASSNPAVATVDDSGNVTIVGKGETTLTISAIATQLFNAADPVEVKLTVADAAAAPAAKSANSLKIAKVTRTVKGVSKAKKTVAGAKVSAKGEGSMTWKKVKVVKGTKAAAKNVAKKITVNKSNGKITVKKGLAKGTYKVTVSAKAAGDATHEASKVLKAVVTLKVKK